MVFVLFLIGFATNSFAEPLLSDFLEAEGVRLYKDHQQSSLFYISPPPPVLNITSGSGYSLDVFRYLGTKATGDQGKFRVRGVLSLSFMRAHSPAQIGKIKRYLRTQKVKKPRLMSVPVSKTTVRLIYGGTEKRIEYGSRFTPKEVRIPLDSLMAELLWEAVEAGQTQVSIVIEETIAGLVKQGDEWQEEGRVNVHTVPVIMDMESSPSSFVKLDMDARIQRGYKGVDVFCYDFLEATDENLYARQVELSVQTPGKPLVESVEFKENTEYRARIDFTLSKETNEPYLYRITSIFKDGSKETTPWMKKQGDTLLDITQYKDEPEQDENTIEQGDDCQ